jgi:alkanesulfonate monooxygenase SsuD/methylene tetrahydromethanopterin reductase-like flavin-dependent oxidoreductase (luciferase family)
MGRAIAPIPPDVVLRRVGRMADGWFPIFKPSPEGDIALKTMRDAAVEAGRDPDSIVMDQGIQVEEKDAGQLREEILKLRDFGAHRITFGLKGDSIAAHMAGVQKLADMLDTIGE